MSTIPWQDNLVKEAGKLGLKPQAMTVAAEETPKVAEPPAADTIPGATAEQKTAPAVSNEPLPELPDDVSINPQQILKEATERKQWAQAAGQKFFEIEEGLKKLEEMAAADPDVVISPAYQTERQRLQNLHDQLGTVGGEELQKRLRFAKLIEEIRRADARNFNAVQAMIAKILETGRYRLATTEEFKSFVAAKKCPWGAILNYAGKTYIPAIPAEKAAEWKITPATRMLESAFRKMIVAAKEHHRSEVEVKITSIKERGGNKPIDLLNGTRGLYYLYSPQREKGGVKIREGHVLLEVRDDNRDPKREPFLVVHVAEALGSLTWMNDGRRDSFPLYWLQRGFVPHNPKRPLEDNDRRRAVGMIATVRALIQFNTPTTTTETTAEPATPAPTESAQTQPAPEAMTAAEQVAAAPTKAGKKGTRRKK
jgi:hypothetical protein